MSNQENFEEAKQERIPFNPSEKPYKKAEIPISLFTKKGIDIDHIIKENGFLIDVRDDNQYSLQDIIDRCYNVIDLIINKQSNSNCPDERYACISYKVLRKIKDYPKDLINFLELNGIIESNNHYDPGKHSIGYRLTDKYEKIKTVSYMCQSRSIVKRIRKEIESIHPLTKYFNQSLSIVLTEAQLQKIVEESIDEYSEKPKIKKLSYYEKRRKFKKYGVKISNQLNQSILRITHNRHYYKATNSGRHFHTLSGCKSELRPYLKYNQDALHEVDIKNASSYFIVGLLERPECTIEYILEADPNLDKSSLTSHIKAIPVQEKKLFTELAITGKLYEFLQSKHPNKIERNKIKNQFYKYTYDKNSHSSKLKTVFQTEFPNLSKLFTDIKTNFALTRAKGRKDSDTSNALCHAIYKTESNLVINTIASSFIEQNPDIPIYTVHDSFLTTSEGMELLIPLMKAKSKLLIGYEVPYSIKMSKLSDNDNVEDCEPEAYPADDPEV